MLQTEWTSKKKYLVGPVFFNTLNTAFCKVIAVKKPSLVSVVIVTDARIKKINEQAGAGSYVTDVLSFAFGEDMVVDSTVGATEHVGEIVINYQQAGRQAKKYGHSIRTECALLYVHGLLHIFGYDHQNSVQKKHMESLEQKIVTTTYLHRV